MKDEWCVKYSHSLKLKHYHPRFDNVFGIKKLYDPSPVAGNFTYVIYWTIFVKVAITANRYLIDVCGKEEFQ
jgi:hypothetical protein